MQAATEGRKHLCGRVGLCGPRERLENVRVGYVSEKKMTVWTSWPVKAAVEARKRLRS